MDPVLEEEILRKCRRMVSPEETHIEVGKNEKKKDEIREENDETLLEKLEEVTKVSNGQLPFQDILAEKRRKYTVKEEFISLLYNDILKHFITEWDGQFLRRKVKHEVEKDKREFDGPTEEIEDTESIDESMEYPNRLLEDSNENHSKASKLFWWLKFPDEFSNISFISKNTYSGRISRKMMEGEGVYKWYNGVQYKGQFQQNKMQGKGFLEWNNECWYEGAFMDGCRHGKGMMVDTENHCMYIGDWHMGRRHGNGYCRIDKNNSYDGDWVMDQMDGVGLRIYPSGARYFGQWKNNVYNGTGTIVWTNGDIYRGGWKSGKMHGYGEYTWNTFFNKALSWPREASYMGNWERGMRNGKGVLKLNTMGGSKYSGYWKDNKKHGYGIIIGNNGEITEANPLFLNDNLVSFIKGENLTPLNKENESEHVKAYTDEIDTPLRLFPKKPPSMTEVLRTPILNPEQFPSMSYHCSRLFTPRNANARSPHSVSSGKCYVCKDNKSCTCVAHGPEVSDRNGQIIPSNTTALRQTIGVIEHIVQDLSTFEEGEYEERWLYNCLTMHMPRLRQIYTDYATLFAPNETSYYSIMSKLSLWQLWKDCGINKQLGLIEIDSHIANNKSVAMDDPYYPFETIDIWQFLHVLLEVAWHLYAKYGDINNENMNGKLAGGLHKLLLNDIYPNVGKHMGYLCREYLDLLPIYSVFELYQGTGYPLSARDLLRGKPNPEPASSTRLSSVAIPHHLRDGFNCVTVGERISYLPKTDETSMLPPKLDSPKRYDEKLAHGLLAFRQLGATRLMDIIATICPLIEDADSGAIVNIDYKLTFLEFYEILLQAGKELLQLRKKLTNQAQRKEFEAEIASLNPNNLQEAQTSRPVEQSSLRNVSKSKKKSKI